jgi:predicted metal-dependent hydrolase
MDELPEKYLEGIRLFNEADYFECHEVLEDLWTETLGEEQKFYQGLIQAAVGMLHFGNDNLGGARKLYNSARQKLEQYPTPYCQLDLLQFLLDFEFCFQELLDAGDTYPENVRLQDDRIPVMRLVETESQDQT